MKFHLLSSYGEGCGLMKRIQDEGNEVTVQIEDINYSTAFNGILKRSKGAPNGAIIIVDASGMGEKADNFRRRGFRVFGGSAFADKLEDERDFGLAFMKDHGIKTPDAKVFRTFSEAMDWLKEQKGKDTYVFKPNGSLPCRLTYCSTDNEDLMLYLRFVQRHFSHQIDDFILQTFVEGPIVSTEFWVGPNGLIRPANHTVEVKKFLNDNLGPSTGCQGNLVWVADDDEVVSLLEGVEEDLVKEGYVGPIDLNAILSEEGPRGLEWTPRFGLDAMPAMLCILEGDVGKLISDIVNGQTDEMDLADAVAGGIRLSIPPYPIEPTDDLRKVLDQSPNMGVPIKDLDEKVTYFYEVMMWEGQLVHSPGTGVVAVVTDCADNPRDSLTYPYEVLEECRVPDKQYRTDLQTVLPEMCEEACEALNYVST